MFWLINKKAPHVGVAVVWLDLYCFSLYHNEKVKGLFPLWITP